MNEVFEVAKAELESLKASLEAHITQLTELRENALSVSMLTLLSGAKYFHLDNTQSFQLGVELVDALLLNLRSKLTLVTNEIAKLSKPEPETLFNTPNKWFDWDEVDHDQLSDSEEYLVVATPEASWVSYCKSGKTEVLDYYGEGCRFTGAYCVEKANLLAAGIHAAGGNGALVVIKRVG